MGIRNWFSIAMPFYAEDDNNSNAGDEAIEIDEGDTNDDENDSEGNEDEDGEDESGDEEEGEEQEGKSGKKDGEEEELTRVSLSEINKTHPDFFKKYPSLKHAFFREQRFTQIFPTIEDAQRAADEQSAYLEISEAVVSGDTDRFIKELKNADDKALEVFSENYLKSLHKENKDVYYNLITPVVSGLIKNVYKYGLSNKNDNVQKAAKIVFKELGLGEYADVEKDDSPSIRRSGMRREEDDNNEKDEKDNKELNEKQKIKYDSLRAEVGQLFDTTLDSEISKRLDDVKGRDGLKKIAVKEIRGRIYRAMADDNNYIRRMDSLWQREKRLGFNGSLKESFKVNFLGKARTLIPRIVSEVRKEILNDTGKQSNNDKEPNRHGPGSRSSGNSGKITVEQAKRENLTAREVFDR